MGSLVSRSRPGLGTSLIVLGLAACMSCRQNEEDRPYRTGTIELREDGSLQKGQLVDEADVAGYPGKRGGWVRFHESGAIRGVQLARDFEVAGRLVPAATYVWFDENGQLSSAWLARDMTYDGVPCDGGWSKVSTGFYPDGTLRSVYLSRDAIVQGVPCRRTLFEAVEFHPDGKLKSAPLAADFVHSGVAFDRGDTLQLDAEGELADG